VLGDVQFCHDLDARHDRVLVPAVQRLHGGWIIPSTRNFTCTCFSLASMWTSLARCSRAFSRMVSTSRMVGLASLA